MSVQVSWLLTQSQLHLTRRAGPRNGTVPITFVHATELVDPGPWLSGGELVLTTGLSLSEDSGQQRAYVDRLGQAGVSCVGFGIGLSHTAIPTPFLEEADARGLTVLEVPFEIPFAAIVRTVMNKIAEQEYEQVLRAAQVQSRITRAALQGGVDAIVRELAVTTSTTVAYVGHRRDSVHPVTERAFVSEVRALAGSRRRSGSAVSIASSEPERTVAVHSVGLSEATSGYLAMATAGPPTSIEQVLLGHAVSLVTLELEQPARLRAEQSKLNTLALSLLLDGRLDFDSTPGYLGDATGPDGSVRVLIVGTDSVENTTGHLDEALARAGRGLFATTESGDVLVLLHGDDDVDMVDSLLPGGNSIRAGLSARHPASETFEARAQARMALGLAGSDPAERIVEFGRTRGSVVLGSDAARQAFMTLASSTVSVLAEHDHAHHGELLLSLRTYLETNGQWEAASTRLGVHRHTLRGRITRAEEILDLDLGSARVRAELLLAMVVSDGDPRFGRS